MAIGDDAQNAGYPLVPDSGEDGKVKWGAREINRTRDFIAQIKAGLPVGVSGYQQAAGISMGTADPVNSDGKPNGVIYYKILT